MIQGDSGEYKKLECITNFNQKSTSDFDEFAGSKLGLLKYDERSDLQPLELITPE